MNYQRFVVELDRREFKGHFSPKFHVYEIWTDVRISGQLG